jgi:hypothetical protein
MVRTLAAAALATITLTLGCCESIVLADPVEPPAPAPSGAPSAPVRLTERQKIDRMLELLAASDAVFIRNGEEHSGNEAAAHLRTKLNSAGDLIPSARAFIEQIASKSSASGKPYMVRPKGKDPVESGAWFTELLRGIENPGATAAGETVSAGKSFVALGVPFSITLDCSEAPELKEWGEKARAICEKQYPILCEMLNSDGFTPRSDLRIVFKGSMGAPAATGGGTISVNAPYVTQHMGDFGMMVHELTHAVQQYRRAPRGANMGWLTEGIADYTRFYKYEPGADHSRIDPKKASYHDSYRTTAAFLNFLVVKHDKEIVQKLNARMRAGTCEESTFKELLGEDVGDLWKEFIAELNKEPRR